MSRMDDLISRQAAIDALGGEPIAYTEYEQGLHDKWIYAKENIEALPSTQPEIIRCRECKHALPQGEYGDWFICDVWDHQIHTSLNGYCYKAERKEHEIES